MEDSLLVGLGRRVVSGVRQAVSFVGRIWGGIRSRVRRLWGSARDLFEAAVGEGPDAAEAGRRAAVTDALRKRFGERPLEVLRELPPPARGEMLDEVAARACEALGIPPVTVSVEPMAAGLAGNFSLATRHVTVSQDEAAMSPMDDDEALELIDTVLHEVYHSFQREAIEDARRHGVASGQAETWREEFAHYVSPDQNPRAYWQQSVEVTARGFAHAVSTAL